MSIRLFFCLFIIIKNSLALESPCYKEDFSNSFGIMDRSCDENFKSFALETFENQKDIPIPNYSNGYFIMSNDQGDSCIKSSATLSIPAGSTVDLNIFTKNSGNRSSRVLLTISDELGIAGFENEIVDNTAQWRSFIGNVFRGTSNGQITIQTDNLGDAFLAIDYVIIRESGADNCVFNSSTTESPLTTTFSPETTTVASLTTTSSPEITTTVIQTTTSSPESTTAAIQTTTSSSETTTAASQTTTSSPEITTATIQTTTSSPETTTAAIQTTTSSSETTTAAIQTTTSSSETTTAANQTTTSSPETTTAASQTTTFSPEITTATIQTTTSSPETTTASIQTTTSFPETTNATVQTTSSSETTTAASQTTTSSAETTTASIQTTMSSSLLPTTVTDETPVDDNSSDARLWKILGISFMSLFGVCLLYSIVITIIFVRGKLGFKSDIIPYGMNSYQSF